MKQINDFSRWSPQTIRTVQWLCNHALKGSRPTYAQFCVWFSKNVRGGKEAQRKTWQELYDARIVDTMNPNDSYEFNSRD